MSDEKASEARTFDQEVLKRVVMPGIARIIDAMEDQGVENATPDVLYNWWIQDHGHVSRARFQRWLDDLGVRFVRCTKVWMPDPKDEAPRPRVEDDEAFDNE